MQVRPITGMPRASYRVIRRAELWLLRWTFIAIGAATAATVLFSYLFHVNERSTIRRCLRSASAACSR